ncbi:Clp1/GlmU family protein [Kushneria phosphatilytica]|nr:Clp1/GlmU family protein [Kushneria phosphatilytica]OHV13935.1 hypothetical protein BH688_00895 [Kushneria phosphatilytica]
MTVDETEIRLPAGWQTAIEQILANGGGRVLVLGAVDSGKSTFCRALMAAADRRACTYTLVDTDPGQKMVGPPATLSRSQPTTPDRLAAIAFVGTTSAAEALSGVRQGLPRLMKHHGQTTLTVINTSGLLSGRGRALKATVIDAARPQLIVVLGDDPALDAILQPHRRLPVLRLAASPHARRRGRNERRRARMAAFAEYFGEAAHAVTLPLKCARWQGDREPIPRQLVGLADQNGQDRALGVILERPDQSGVSLLAPECDISAIRLLRPGRLLLSESWEAMPIGID